jgi:nitroreductase
MSFLDNLTWRQATKEFDTNKPVSAKNLNQILNAIRMAPTSYGLQPFHIYVIKKLAFRKKIKNYVFLQKQIDTCSHLIVFCAINSHKKIYQRVDDYTQLLKSRDKTTDLKLQAIKLARKKSLQNKTPADFEAWATRQCYIALGFALAGAAELKIDSCPMEGYDKVAIDKILKLPAYLQSSVLLPIGYRKEEQKKAKIRFPNNDLFTHL